MPNATEIREFCYNKYVIPARNSGNFSITVRAGTVRDDIVSAGLGTAEFPAICAALGATLFETHNKNCLVKRIHVEGPLNGANTYLTYLILENLGSH